MLRSLPWEFNHHLSFFLVLFDTHQFFNDEWKNLFINWTYKTYCLWNLTPFQRIKFCMCMKKGLSCLIPHLKWVIIIVKNKQAIEISGEIVFILWGITTSLPQNRTVLSETSFWRCLGKHWQKKYTLNVSKEKLIMNSINNLAILMEGNLRPRSILNEASIE